MNRAFLYIDILGFENLVRTNPIKVDQVFGIIDTLKVHKHFALTTVVFSDTILVFNTDDSLSTDYYCTYLAEYSQQLFYRLSAINVYFKGILTFGEFAFSKLANIHAYYGVALIEAYKDEGTLEGFGLYVDKRLSSEIVVLDKIPFTDKYDFIVLCQSLDNLYSTTDGILPIDINLLSETDDYFRIDEELKFFREIEYLKQHHPVERIRAKYSKVYALYRTRLPLFFKAFEDDGFLPFTINPDYTGSINPFDLLAEQELVAVKKE